MNDAEFKRLLHENLRMPSSEFNARVQSALFVKKKPKPVFVPMDEPLILGMAAFGLFVSAGAFLSGYSFGNGGLLLVLAVVFAMPLFFICCNRIIRKRIDRQSSVI